MLASSLQVTVRVYVPRYDAGTSLQCGPVEGRGDPLRGSSGAAHPLGGLLPLRAVGAAVAAARLTILSSGGGGGIVTTLFREASGIEGSDSNGGGNDEATGNYCERADRRGCRVPVVVPVTRLHPHNHGHVFEDAVAPIHAALKTVRTFPFFHIPHNNIIHFTIASLGT